MGTSDRANVPIDLEWRLLKELPQLRSFVRERSGPRFGHLLDPDDIVQDTAVAAFRSKADCDKMSDQHLHQWLRTVCVRRMTDAVRQIRRGYAAARGGKAQDARMGEKDWETPSRVAMRKEDAQELIEAIADLPSDQREAVHAFYIDDCCIRETARRLKRTPEAVHQLLFRARNVLRNHFDPSRSSHPQNARQVAPRSDGNFGARPCK